MSVSVVVASLSWACGPSGYGVPEAPPLPPASTGQPTGPGATSTVPPASAAPQPSNPATPVQIQSGSAVAKSVAREPSSQSPRTPSQQGASGGNTTPSPSGQADISARIGGSTAGVVSQSGQSVFASSTAPRATQASRGKSKASSSSTSKAPAVSERSATGDLWGAVTSNGKNPSLASAAGPESGGLSGGVVAAIAILGLGLAGITGGALATAGRRRRAAAGTAKR